MKKATDTAVEQGVYEVQVADENDDTATMVNRFTVLRAYLTTSVAEIEMPACHLLDSHKQPAN